jgi:hypothetical protein
MASNKNSKATKSSTLTTKTAATKPSTGIAKAREIAKGITSAALASTKAATPKATTPKTTTPKVVSAVPATGSYNYNQMVVANPKAEHRGFFATVARLAAKPITVANLINKVIAEEGSKLTSKKAPALVVRVRVRHAHTRLGVLQSVKASK